MIRPCWKEGNAPIVAQFLRLFGVGTATITIYATLAVCTNWQTAPIVRLFVNRLLAGIAATESAVISRIKPNAPPSATPAVAAAVRYIYNIIMKFHFLSFEIFLWNHSQAAVAIAEPVWPAPTAKRRRRLCGAATPVVNPSVTPAVSTSNCTV